MRPTRSQEGSEADERRDARDGAGAGDWTGLVGSPPPCGRVGGYLLRRRGARIPTVAGACGLDWAGGVLAFRVSGRILARLRRRILPGKRLRRLLGLRARCRRSRPADAARIQLGRGGQPRAEPVGARERGRPRTPGRHAPPRRSDTEVGFGLGGGLLWYPYLVADATGQKRFGLRLNSGPSLDIGLEFGRMDNAAQPAKEALVLRGDIRFH